MARNRASMREGPLAELFRATEAAQRRARAKGKDAAQQQLPTEPAAPQAEPPAPTPIRAVAPATDPEPDEPRERPVARWLEPLPDQPARLERARDSASYLAVIRVVGVGGAGLNAVDRMIDAGITQVEFVAVNTDIQQLQMSDAPTKIHIGSELTEGPRLGRRSGDRPPGGRGGLRPDQACAPRLRHGLRHRRRGRRHRLGRCAGRREDRARARRAHGRHRHDAVQVRGLAAQEAGRRRRRRRCARRATR